MSSDNFYIVRKHPFGGYAAVQGFASDVDDNEVQIYQNRYLIKVHIENALINLQMNTLLIYLPIRIPNYIIEVILFLKEFKFCHASRCISDSYSSISNLNWVI